MKKIIIVFLAALTMLLGGCAKGEITLELSRWGSADVSCNLVTVPMLQGALVSFQDEFKEDGYNVVPAQKDEMSGFEARKHYDKVADIKDSKVLEIFRFDKLTQAADKHQGKIGTTKEEVPKQEQAQTQPQPEKRMVTIKPGLLYDTITVNTGLNLENVGGKPSLQTKFLLDNFLKQMELKFVVKLPTAADSSDATTVSEDGKTLTWMLNLGGKTPINAQITYLNPIKAGSWAALVILLLLGAICYHSYKKNRANKQGAVQNDANTGTGN